MLVAKWDLLQGIIQTNGKRREKERKEASEM